MNDLTSLNTAIKEHVISHGYNTVLSAPDLRLINPELPYKSCLVIRCEGGYYIEKHRTTSLTNRFKGRRVSVNWIIQFIINNSLQREKLQRENALMHFELEQVRKKEAEKIKEFERDKIRQTMMDNHSYSPITSSSAQRNQSNLDMNYSCDNYSTWK
ncbi:hypothetical protein [Shewanella sp. 10N.286.52.A9]|uniref:hypothetical protein n=1 Tax=Shewanella sp. 10N.286.52.A9 TaxID=3229711 RepID=UPI00354F094B